MDQTREASSLCVKYLWSFSTIEQVNFRQLLSFECLVLFNRFHDLEFVSLLNDKAYDEVTSLNSCFGSVECSKFLSSDFRNYCKTLFEIFENRHTYRASTCQYRYPARFYKFQIRFHFTWHFILLGLIL